MPENKPINIEELNYRGGKYYLKNTQELYSGPLEKTDTQEGFFKDGLFSGTITDIDIDLYTDITTFKDGQKERLERYRNKTKEKWEEINYKDGKQEGLESVWYKGGQKRSDITYKDGKREGPATHWHVNGQLKSEGNYKDGDQEGLMESWYYDGIKEYEKNYKDGMREGSQIFWYEKGNKRYERSYIADKREGLETQYHENGQIESTENYKADKQHGLTSWYNDEGTMTRERNYKEGQLDGLMTQFFDGGKTLIKTIYLKGEEAIKISHGEQPTITELGLESIEELIREKHISVDITNPNYKLKLADQLMHFFGRDDTPVGYITKIVEANPASIQLYDEVIHGKFVEAIDTMFPDDEKDKPNEKILLQTAKPQEEVKEEVATQSEEVNEAGLVDELRDFASQMGISPQGNTKEFRELVVDYIQKKAVGVFDMSSTTATQLLGKPEATAEYQSMLDEAFTAFEFNDAESNDMLKFASTPDKMKEMDEKYFQQSENFREMQKEYRGQGGSLTSEKAASYYKAQRDQEEPSIGGITEEELEKMRVDGTLDTEVGMDGETSYTYKEEDLEKMRAQKEEVGMDGETSYTYKEESRNEYASLSDEELKSKLYNAKETVKILSAVQDSRAVSRGMEP